MNGLGSHRDAICQRAPKVAADHGGNCELMSIANRIKSIAQWPA